jgi:hypothetical protein
MITELLFYSASRTAVGPTGPTQPPIQWILGALSLGVKRLGREADPSPPSSAEVKNALSYTSTPHYVFMAWCLLKHRDNFTFAFTYTTQPNTTCAVGRAFLNREWNVCFIYIFFFIIRWWIIPYMQSCEKYVNMKVVPVSNLNNTNPWRRILY